MVVNNHGNNIIIIAIDVTYCGAESMLNTLAPYNLITSWSRYDFYLDFAMWILRKRVT